MVYNNYSQNTIIFPHRVLVLERPGGFASIHYDLPSSQIKIVDEETRAAACRLDERLDKLCRLMLNVDEEKNPTAALSDKTNTASGSPMSKGTSMAPNKIAGRKKASITNPLYCSTLTLFMLPLSLLLLSHLLRPNTPRQYRTSDNVQAMKWYRKSFETFSIKRRNNC